MWVLSLSECCPATYRTPQNTCAKASGVVPAAPLPSAPPPAACCCSCCCCCCSCRREFCCVFWRPKPGVAVARGGAATSARTNVRRNKKNHTHEAVWWGTAAVSERECCDHASCEGRRRLQQTQISKGACQVRTYTPASVAVGQEFIAPTLRAG